MITAPARMAGLGGELPFSIWAACHALAFESGHLLGDVTTHLTLPISALPLVA